MTLVGCAMLHLVVNCDERNPIMFELAELGNKVSKAEYRERQPQMRVDLLNAQFELREADFSTLILVAGDDRPGCEECVDLLHEWMDARYLGTQVFAAPSEEERERPRFWRYWRTLPQRGSIGLYLGAWPMNLVASRLRRELDEEDFERVLGHVRGMERALAEDGTLILKFWLHTPKKVHKRRLEGNGKLRLWSPTRADRRIYGSYDRLVRVAEHMVRETDRQHAPWTIVESTDREHRNLVVAETIRAGLRGRLDGKDGRTEEAPAHLEREMSRRSILESVDLSKRLERDDYREKLRREQRRLSRLSVKAREAGLSSVLVFEGWDAGGKGGIIRRLTQAMAARDYAVHPTAAPTEEERAHHYLWRFWRKLPGAGRMAIFDRSWYGRVLVERVEGFASAAQWRRAYSEIADFEDQLLESGAVLLKFWLHIDPNEQLRRFQAREETPYKKHKITRDDFRNRERWGDYLAAVDEMVERTHTRQAPWILVPANDKRWARIEVLRAVCRALEGALEK